MKVQVIAQIPGPHEGWCRQRFAHRDAYYELLTIDTATDQRSHLSLVTADGNRIAGPVATFPQVLSPDCAFEILVQKSDTRAEGYVEGRGDAQRAMQKALGL